MLPLALVMMAVHGGVPGEASPPPAPRVAQALAERLGQVCPAQAARVPALERVVATVTVAMVEQAPSKPKSRSRRRRGSTLVDLQVFEGPLAADGLPVEPRKSSRATAAGCISVSAPTRVDWRKLRAEDVRLGDCDATPVRGENKLDFNLSIQVHVDCAHGRLAVVVPNLPFAVPEGGEEEGTYSVGDNSIWLDLHPGAGGLDATGGCIPDWNEGMRRTAGLGGGARVHDVCMPLYLPNPETGNLQHWRTLKPPAAQRTKDE